MFMCSPIGSNRTPYDRPVPFREHVTLEALRERDPVALRRILIGRRTSGGGHMREKSCRIHSTRRSKRDSIAMGRGGSRPFQRTGSWPRVKRPAP